MKDGDFYKQIEQRRKDIASSKIPEEEKQKLYDLVDGTVQRHEQNKRYSQEFNTVIEKRDVELRKFTSGIVDIGNTINQTKNEIPNLERAAASCWLKVTLKKTPSEDKTVN